MMLKDPAFALLLMISAFAFPAHADEADSPKPVIALSPEECSKAPSEEEYERIRAESGDTSALINLGRVYREEGNLPEAVKYFGKAAALGSGDALAFMGRLHCLDLPDASGETSADISTDKFDAKNYPPDHAEAARWFLSAAEQRNEYAMSFLSDMYHEGTGVKQDYAEAYFWLTLAREDDSFPDLSVKEFKRLEEHLTPEQVTAARDRAKQWSKLRKNEMAGPFRNMLPDDNIYALLCGKPSRECYGVQEVCGGLAKIGCQTLDIMENGEASAEPYSYYVNIKSKEIISNCVDGNACTVPSGWTCPAP